MLESETQDNSVDSLEEVVWGSQGGVEYSPIGSFAKGVYVDDSGVAEVRFGGLLVVGWWVDKVPGWNYTDSLFLPIARLWRWGRVGQDGRGIFHELFHIINHPGELFGVLSVDDLLFLVLFGLLRC